MKAAGDRNAIRARPAQREAVLRAEKPGGGMSYLARVEKDEDQGRPVKVWSVPEPRRLEAKSAGSYALSLCLWGCTGSIPGFDRPTGEDSARDQLLAKWRGRIRPPPAIRCGGCCSRDRAAAAQCVELATSEAARIRNGAVERCHLELLRFTHCC